MHIQVLDDNKEVAMYKRYIKRCCDVILSVIALLILMPCLMVIGILIRLSLRKPILFIQQRIGKDNKPFDMLKFRSMTDKRDQNNHLLPDNERLTSFGRFLRKTSIDELPALLNVIKGEMSLIGPRPLPIVYYPYFSDEELHRHDVRGGLTGLAQINGRNALTWEQKFGYDLEYVRNISFVLDCKIFLKTIVKVFKRSDVLTRRDDGKGDLDAQREPMREGISL